MRRLFLAVFCLAFGLSFAAPAVADGPDVSVQTPVEGSTIDGSSFVVRFEVTGLKVVPTNVPVSEAGKHPEVNRPGEGHLHFTLDLDPLVVWDKTAPYVFDNVPPGEHVLMVSLAQNDHSPLSPPVMKEIRFRTGPQALPKTGDGLPWSAGPSLVGLAFALIVVGLSLRGQAESRLRLASRALEVQRRR